MQLKQGTQKSFSQRVLLPALQTLSRPLARIAPDALIQETAHNLVRAGNPGHLTPMAFLAIKAAVLVLLPGAYATTLIGTSNLGLPQLLVLCLLVLLGLRGPDLWLRRKGEARMAIVNRALPDALDLMVICIEAGLGFDAALGRVADRMQGPLAEEIRRTMAEMSMGKRRREALKAMVARCPAPDLVSFVAVVSQADQTGVSVGNVLRVQADALRVKRRQRAQEEGHKAPLKMLFPLIFFILPATFAVILGPAALSVMDSFVGVMRP
jgi:tight adherence protein C